MNVGSKVPFAYTDSFFVKTTFEGIEYKYLCYIDASQLGAISLLHTQETKAENGTEIIIPIKDKWEQQKFQGAIYKQLSYFNNFKYIGFDKPNNVITFEDEDCIISTNPPYGDLHIVLGNVAYPIDINVAGFDRWADGIQGCKVGLKFKIGELQPTLSRENIFWNDKIKNLVREKVERVRKTIRTELEKELALEKDYLRWYSNTVNRKTKKFPDQWNFSKIKTDAEYKLSDGTKLITRQLPNEWFAGLNVRKVTTYQGYSSRRRTIKKDPDYTASAASVHDLAENIPVYQLSGPLSARKCLFLFKTNPKGFIAVSHIGIEDLTDNKKKELKCYYDEATRWMSTLPSYDALIVPEGEFLVNSDIDIKEAYKALQKQRKLEGKFTAKKLRVSEAWTKKLDEIFEYGLYESKFEDHKTDLIVYGFQEDNDLLLKATAILTYSEKYGDKTVDLLNDDFIVLKISKNYTKQFEFMSNAFYIKDVLSMKTTLNESLADIITAHKFESKINQYSILDNFESINHEKTVQFKELKKFIQANTRNKRWHEIGLLSEITKLCEDNGIVNQEMIESFEEIEDYFHGAELLKYVKFDPEAIPSIRRYMALTKGDEETYNTKVEEDIIDICLPLNGKESTFVEKVESIKQVNEVKTLVEVEN